jgi:hypothetical protein
MIKNKKNKTFARIKKSPIFAVLKKITTSCLQ